MNIALLILIVLALAALAGFYGGLRKIRHYLRAGGGATAPAVRLANIPSWYGWYVGLWALIPALLVWLSLTLAEGHTVRQLTHMGLEKQDISTEFNRQQWREIERYRHQEPRPAVLSLGGMDAETLIPVLEQAERQQSWFTLASVLLMVVLGIGWALPRVRPAFTARRQVERFIRSLLLLAAVLSVLVTVTIILSVVFESVRFFGKVPLTEFLFGTQWSPQTALRADQAGASGSFGAIPLFVGTFLIMIIAMIVAAPLGLLSAVYMSEYASPRFRAVAKPVLEVLAGIPTVVYGYFAILIIAPFLQSVGAELGLTIASESALAAGLVMGVMLIPYVSSLSDDVITAVPRSLRDASYGLGATQSETIRKVVLPAALPGIVGAMLLAISRAIGETMIVVMAAGLAANLTLNPIESVTTVTAQIVSLLVGDQEFDSAKTLAAFALGLTLFCMTLLLNVAALMIVKAFREKYD
jgi:phosphate transport system permease protein